MSGTPPAPASWICLIPLAAAVIVAYLGYATWVACGPPDTIDPLGTLAAETLDAILMGDVTEACPVGLEWDLAG